MLLTSSFGTSNSGRSSVPVGDGTLGYTILNPDNTEAQGRTTSGIIELITGSGTYGVELDTTPFIGKTIVWDILSTGKTAAEYIYANDNQIAATVKEELVDSFDAIIAALPVPPDNASITLIRKILANKTVDAGDTFTIYDDDGVSVLGVFSWSSLTGTRGALSNSGG